MKDNTLRINPTGAFEIPVDKEIGQLPVRSGTLSFDRLISHTFTIHDCLLPSPVDVEFSNGVMVWKGTANLAALLDTTPSAKTMKRRIAVKGRKVLKLTFKRPKHKSYSGSLKITSIEKN